jgi:DNA-binding CsgD family transcriptional regulator/transcriptional regulator with GAF, ATPase, and Fis domain
LKPRPALSFQKKFSSWSKDASRQEHPDWTEQLRILNDIADLVTPQLSLEEIAAAIYENVNHLLDAYQFAVGIYDEKEGTLLYKGMIEAGKRIPDFVIDITDSRRLTAWCIRNEQDIFMNDFDKEYGRYLDQFPHPLAGVTPKAALYTPLKLHDKVVGLINVRTIHKNVYRQHHLYILKAVGNFVVRALELAKTARPPAKDERGKKTWQWCDPAALPHRSKKALALLTERERDVLFLLLTGIPNKTIAQKLFVSAGTVKTHTLNIYQKLEVDNRTAAILKAVEWGWVF